MKEKVTPVPVVFPPIGEMERNPRPRRMVKAIFRRPHAAIFRRPHAAISCIPLGAAPSRPSRDAPRSFCFLPPRRRQRRGPHPSGTEPADHFIPGSRLLYDQLHHRTHRDTMETVPTAANNPGGAAVVSPSPAPSVPRAFPASPVPAGPLVPAAPPAPPAPRTSSALRATGMERVNKELEKLAARSDALEKSVAECTEQMVASRLSLNGIRVLQAVARQEQYPLGRALQ